MTSFLFLFMFDYLSPFFYNHPRYYIRRFDPVEHYLYNLQRQLNDLLDDDYEYDCVQPKSEKKEEKKKEVTKQEEPKDKKEDIKKEEIKDKKEETKDKKEEIKKDEKKDKMNQYIKKQQRYEIFNNHNYIEEHHEESIDFDGNKHIVDRRQLGNRWYERESLINSEGKESTKESWHNIPDKDIESFKEEWNTLHGIKTDCKPTEALEHKSESKPKEENKSEEKPKEETNNNQ